VEEADMLAWRPALVVIMLLAPATASAAGKCDDGGEHGAAVAAAREAVRRICDCEGAESRAAYLACAWDVIQQQASIGALPKMCRGRVRQFAGRSTCGRDELVACCVKHETGPWRPVLRKRAVGCAPPRTGGIADWCEAHFAHLDYACLPESACRVNVCGDGILDRSNGEACEPPGVGLCDPFCQEVVCGNGVLDPFEECEPPNTPTCNEECYFTHDCGNGVVDAGWGEECEPPGTATCDPACHFIHTCGNGVVEPGEECDGQSLCGSECRLARTACCDFGGACLGATVYDDFSAYFNLFKPCYQVLGGAGSYGTCEGSPCPPPAPPDIGCHVGSCTDRPIDPLPLCCQQAAGGCRDMVATTAGAIGGFGCSSFPPPDRGDVDRLMIGTCGGDGRCVPAS
jgi:hypothetical protein